MKNEGRYKVTSTESEFEPGSNGQVLKNLLGITQPEQIDKIEMELLSELTEKLLEELDHNSPITVELLIKIHRDWLKILYPWAGELRNVNLSKDDFTFAAAHLLPKLLENFEQDVLTKYTPCNFTDLEKLLTALATVHVELVLIHPFREGNGRLARLISIIMALQAGQNILDFSPIDGIMKEKYFAAVRAGLELNYVPMQEIFRLLIQNKP